MLKKLLLLSILICTPAFSFFSLNQLDTNPNSIKEINPVVLRLAMEAYHCAEAKGWVRNHTLTVVDFTLPSTKKRMWIIDPKKHITLYALHVAHGVNSGFNIATHFSNKPGSLETSLGAYLTGGTYEGHHGYSLMLIGLEKGINNNALRRHIIMHSAWYVNPGFIHRYDRLGRSWGCFALNPTKTREVINAVKGGSVLFAYAAQEKTDYYLKSCNFIR